MYIKLRSENLKARAYSEDPGVDGTPILKCVLGKIYGNLWSGFIWLGIGTSGVGHCESSGSTVSRLVNLLNKYLE
jgi:hypothetical protein